MQDLINEPEGYLIPNLRILHVPRTNVPRTTIHQPVVSLLLHGWDSGRLRRRETEEGDSRA